MNTYRICGQQPTLGTTPKLHSLNHHRVGRQNLYLRKPFNHMTQLNQEMAETTDLQHAFTVAYVTNGGNASEAARQAGYKKSAARVIGSRLIRDVKIQRLIRSEQARILGGKLCSKALGLLEQILDDPNAPAGARVDAAKTILDRGGLPALRQTDVINDNQKSLNRMTVDELNAFIVSGNKELKRLQEQREALPHDDSSITR